MPRLSAIVRTSDQTLQTQITRLLRSSGLAISVIEERHFGGGSAPHLAIVDVRGNSPEARAELGRVKAAWPSAVLCAVAENTDPDHILEAMRAGANEFLAWPSNDPGSSGHEAAVQTALRQTVERIRATNGDNGASCSTFSFFGAKGGAGTTTIAVNTAVEIARTSKRPTLIVDLNQYLGEVALFLGVRPRFTLVDALDNLHRLDSEFLREVVVRHQSGLDILAGSEQVDRPGPQDAAALDQLLRLLARGYEFIVLDVGTATSPCAEVAVHAADTIHLVANPDVPSIRNVKRLADRMTQLGAVSENLRVLLNRTSDQHLIEPRQIETALGRDIHQAFSSDYNTVSAALNSGVPLTLTNHSELASQFNRFTRGILNVPLETEAAEPGRWRGHFLGLF